MSSSTNPTSSWLTPVAAVGNLVEKVDRCPLNWESLRIVCVQLGVQGLLKYYSEWKVRIFVSA